MRAIVVFTDGSAGHPLAFLLKRGFKHCFVCVVAGSWWLQIDGADGVPTFRPLTDATFDLAAFWREAGATVIETEQRQRPLWRPFVPNNCVGLVIAVLCLRTWALTPFQLFNHLVRDHATSSRLRRNIDPVTSGAASADANDR